MRKFLSSFGRESRSNKQTSSTKGAPLSTKSSKLAAKKVVFVLGPPGSGKDTQCQRIAHTFGFVLISVGEILRHEMNSMESSCREEIATCMVQGKIVPGEITCKLLERHMQSTRKTNFLLAGFPRNEENLNRWEKMVGSKIDTAFVLCIECPEHICMDRCLNRDSGRLDDTEEVLEKRFNTYRTETQPIIACFEKKRLLHTVDGNEPEDVVFEQIKHIFESRTFLPI